MDHVEIGDRGGGMADPTKIGNRKDHTADSAEISDKDDHTTNSRVRSGTKRRQEEDQAQEHAAGYHSGATGLRPGEPSLVRGRRAVSKTLASRSFRLTSVDTPVMGRNAQEARGSLVHMEGAQSPWRPWTPTDSHAKKDRVHKRGEPGAATKRTKLKERAQPRRGPSSRSGHSHEEDQAQGACRQLPFRGSRDKSQRNCHRSKEEEQCIGDRQASPEEEEQCRRRRHSSGGQEWR
ncbi:uncharacterized protein UHOD_11067 [Ustilago sp. UG-2017b]|nr:uncharacterized protein UHOD_11067 [Ustilago sp. UG-2017b]